ncbi:hypothetical protein PHLGIDRAFT_119876 [Phlebiopsis gigantea 11061_1 CR5-6]|uniref:Core Histone H2A/H2B/H3 domain-containing protein n=1 Tax=Phlebiopsis gigantea (strain 11061_1 CR5-6) TaxID=745531 RepID=A0A0C3RVM0_PHLG1|nr:hypothetical protein PHLGIDRAFT_119876 [Phlebiopsis gigantea 11061_1 CR5-6]
MAMNTMHTGVHHAPHVAHLDDEMDVDPNGADELGDAETEYDEEVDEEVDQLDSDTEDEAAPPVQSASPPKARQRRTVQRVAGQSAIPLERVRTILDAEGMAETTSKEAMFALAVATEAFTKRLAEAGNRQAATERRSTITYRDFAVAASQYQSLKFLRGTPLLSSPSLYQRRAAKEKELLEPTPTAAPSLAPSVAPSPLPNFTPLPTPLASTAPSISATPHSPSAAAQSLSTRGKGRSSNGAGGGETAPRRQSMREPKPRRRGQDISTTHSVSAGGHVAVEPQPGKLNGTRRTSRSSRSRGADNDSASARSRGMNGTAHHSTGSARSMGDILERVDPDYPMSNGVEDLWEPSGAAQLIGGPGVPFGSGALGLAGNPGRTIYSQQRQPNR